MNAPANFLDLAARLTDRAAPFRARARAIDQARADLERVELGLLTRSQRLGELQRTGADAAAATLQGEIRTVVEGAWLDAQRRLARALDRLGQLPDADRYLLADAGPTAVPDGWQRVPGGVQETPEHARQCVRHPDRLLAVGDPLYCPACRAEANIANTDATASDGEERRQS